MRSRWQLFTSNLVAFGSWYIVSFLLVVWSPLGAIKACSWTALTLACGCVAGAVIGAAIYAIDLHLTHRDVAQGDACDGARVSLGKLPERACRPADQPAADQPTRAAGAAPTALPAGPASTPVPTTKAAGAAVAPSAASTPEADRLADACGAWARNHSAVQVTPAAGGRGPVGRLERAAHPGDFAAFVALVSSLANEGTDVSRVAFTQDVAGLPSSATFPVSASTGEVAP